MKDFATSSGDLAECKLLSTPFTPFSKHEGSWRVLLQQSCMEPYVAS